MTNYHITDKLASFFKNEGFIVELESSKASDYLVLKTNEADDVNVYVIRFSDHDAMTGRSRCANISWKASELHDEYGGKFTGLAEDDDCDKIEFETKGEKDAANFEVIIKEIKGSGDFYRFCKYTKFEFAA